ncbi:MAG: hypothetical protein L0099_09590 [Acidobacteria bacterium]|nr:hypothetical protein [Acidobacteriota bacterium]
MRPRTWARWAYAALGVGSVANGVWMLATPALWFATIPGAADTGPLNPHLVRDYGVCYLIVGAAVLAGLLARGFPYGLHIAVTAFFTGHALLHAWDILAGRLAAHHWRMDFPGVFLPALLLLVMSLPFAWERT